ncbi:MAG: recombinase family protein [Actinobacteria bacterium]|nr:recombinase family protein [Actinomycetota bacterium]
MYQLDSQKLKAIHLERSAYLYIRQSTLRQVYENTESTKRQYGLKQKVMAMGWPSDLIITIDSDLGQSGTSSEGRQGFKKLVSEVGMGHAGLVASLEVSRLCRNSSDWARLLEICALADTLIMDEDGIYDINDFNDRLLLGLKGTMSEAEMHFLYSRMRGGTISKAKRGELKWVLPIGYVYSGDDKIVMDPDTSVQNAVNLFFLTFARTGSAGATVKEFNQKGLKMPIRFRTGIRKGELALKPLTHSRTLRFIHNPLYAGIYCYGRQQIKKTVSGKKSVKMPAKDWHAFMTDAHPGYITKSQFEDNIKKLADNACAHGEDRRKSPPREGPALLQGIIVCGKCGKRMTVRYRQSCAKLVPVYTCQRDRIENGAKVCQTVAGEKVDEEISKLLIEMVNPLAIKAAIKVQNELDLRKLESDKFYSQQVQKAQYEAELAKRRYMCVDPENRLVATELEASWNQKLRYLEETRQNLAKKKEKDLEQIKQAASKDITKIASDFPKIWNSPNVSFREKKRMIRLLIEDVTIKNSDKNVVADIRFKAGTSKTLSIEKKLPMCEIRKTRKDIVMHVDELTENYTPSEIADMLNEKGYRAWNSNLFNLRTISRIIRTYGIKSRHRRLRDKGCLSLREKMKETGYTQEQIMQMRNEGKIVFYKVTDRIEYLYEPQDKDNYLSKIQP